LLMDTGKPRKTCVEVAGRRTFRTLPSRQQSGYMLDYIILYYFHTTGLQVSIRIQAILRLNSPLF